jgi:hypothetical protein
MSTSSARRHSLLGGLFTLTAVAAALAVLAGACDTGGAEGDRCNPLVQQDECDNGLHCTAATCSESYCCRIDGTSSDPHCHAEGCPDPDAGAAEAGSDAAEDAAPEAAAPDAAAEAAAPDAAAEGG